MCVWLPEEANSPKLTKVRFIVGGFYSSVWPISPSLSTGKEEITRCLQGAMEEEEEEGEEAGSRLGVNERTHLIV